MFQVTISGKTKDELVVAATNFIAILSAVKGGDAPLTASEQSRLRESATVVPPTDKAAKKAAEKAAKEAAEKAAKEAAEASDEETSDDDVLGENDAADDGSEELTQDDIKALLVECRAAFPKKTTIISEIVKEHGKAGKLSDVDEKHYPAIAAHCRKLLKK